MSMCFIWFWNDPNRSTRTVRVSFYMYIGEKPRIFGVLGTIGLTGGLTLTCPELFGQSQFFLNVIYVFLKSMPLVDLFTWHGVHITLP